MAAKQNREIKCLECQGRTQQYWLRLPFGIPGSLEKPAGMHEVGDGRWMYIERQKGIREDEGRLWAYLPSCEILCDDGKLEITMSPIGEL